MEVKQEVKTEIKSEESSPLPATPIRVHPATGLPTKEEEYDSSATVSIFLNDTWPSSFNLLGSFKLSLMVFEH